MPALALFLTASTQSVRSVQRGEVEVSDQEASKHLARIAAVRMGIKQECNIQATRTLPQRRPR